MTAGRQLLDNLIAHAPSDAANENVVKRALNAIRAHLGMEVAYISEFVDERAVFREVDAPGLEALIKPGDSQKLEDVYCQHILAGRLPELMPDVQSIPLAASLPISKAVPIGKHMSVPIRLADGSAYGMFCCLGFAADPSLQQRDLQMMRAFADIAAFEINRDLDVKKAGEERRARIQHVIDAKLFEIVFQPIWNVETSAPVGVECLARFSAAPARGPDKWFAEAAEAGLGVALELAAIEAALPALAALPLGVQMGVNASPETVMSGALPRLFEGLPCDRIVLEITEHATVADYDQLMAALQPLRERGVMLAIDDAGAGYSSLRHILHLQPDIIKLDMSLTRNISLDPARRALGAALIGFARQTGSRIVAEGVETAAELQTLRRLGADKAQGYFLGKPMPLSDLLVLLDRAGEAVAARSA
jgi:EAL domain-containing protein (putative c-di-GMP-specific phosphodiesterase class I)